MNSTQHRRITVKAANPEDALAVAERIATDSERPEYADPRGIAGAWSAVKAEPVSAPVGFEAIFPADLSGIYVVDITRTLGR